MTSLQGTGPHRINKQGLCQQVEMEVYVAAESKDFNLKHIQKRNNLNFIKESKFFTYDHLLLS